MLESEERRGGAARDADLRVDVLYVVLRGAAGNVQALRDLRVRAALGHQAQHLDLPVAQAGRTKVARATQPPLSCGIENSHHGVCVEAPGTGVSDELLARLLRGQRLAMGSSLRHRLEGIGGREDAAGGGDVSSAAASVIAGAVQSLDVHSGHAGDRLEGARGREDPFGVV
jgi:hypothetical protein